MQYDIRRADEHHHETGGWFDARWHFSFGGWHDPDRMGVGPLRVFNDDEIVAGAHWPMHPHADIESLSWIVSGHFEHADSLGNDGTFEAGAAQVMRFSSRGAQHSERNASDDEPVRFIQFWILPSQEGLETSVQQRQFTTEERTDQWLRIMERDPAPDSDALELAQDATVDVSRMRPDTALSHTFEPARGGYLYVIDGVVELDDTEKLHPGDALAVDDGGRRRSHHRAAAERGGGGHPRRRPAAVGTGGALARPRLTDAAPGISPAGPPPQRGVVVALVAGDLLAQPRDGRHRRLLVGQLDLGRTSPTWSPRNSSTSAVRSWRSPVVRSTRWRRLRTVVPTVASSSSVCGAVTPERDLDLAADLLAATALDRQDRVTVVAQRARISTWVSSAGSPARSRCRRVGVLAPVVVVDEELALDLPRGAVAVGLARGSRARHGWRTVVGTGQRGDHALADAVVGRARVRWSVGPMAW